MKRLERERAIRLRKAGRSVKEIARELGVSQSSASIWCKDVRLSNAQKQILLLRRRLAGAKALYSINKRRRAEKIADIDAQGRNGKKDVGILTYQHTLMFGLGLYWGEGYKRGSQEWGFTNSDPNIIRSIIFWLKNCYGIDSDRLRARLTINARYRNESERLHAEWSTIANISRKNFSKPSFIRGYGKIGKNPRSYRGTLRIKVRRSTSLRRRILASIEAASNQMTPNSRKTAS